MIYPTSTYTGGPERPVIASQATETAISHLEAALLDLAQALRGETAADGDGVDGSPLIEQMRRFVWHQIFDLSNLTGKPIPDLPRPKRLSRCSQTLSSGRRCKLVVIAEDFPYCWRHSSEDERAEAQVVRDKEKAEVQAFLASIGWPFPIPPTWRALWYSTRRSYISQPPADPWMPVLPPWLYKRRQAMRSTKDKRHSCSAGR